MKRICYIFIYLNIYTGFFLLAHSQDITLTVSFETSMPKTLEDDLAITQKHEDFESVKKEIERLSKNNIPTIVHSKTSYDKLGKIYGNNNI